LALQFFELLIVSDLTGNPFFAIVIEHQVLGQLADVCLRAVLEKRQVVILSVGDTHFWNPLFVVKSMANPV
jgi:hypothetical protein